ncbi:hypothetical protein GCM10007989_03250 [Devosia pacifica]|uniref:Uncharacterized protein n=1 Tax=Devosia pacifica TaxID=1335967 RepID=A0A918VNB4_9HYPH|nr:hypothetical protein [Devosia pacifica]GHA12170.1 hypothetical protein GCM10007989_03250 [Devosia pacifica]
MTLAAEIEPRAPSITVLGRSFALPRKWPTHRLLSGAEQVLTSLISMLGLIAFSRILDVSSFGILGGALGIALIVQFIHDSLTISPFIVVCPEPENDQRTFGDWLVWHFAVAAIMSLALFGLGWSLIDIVPGFAQQVMWAGPILLGAAVYSFSRRMHHHWDELVHLITQTGLYGLVYIVGIYLFWSTGSISATSAATVLALAYGLPGLIFCIRNCLRARFSSGGLTRVLSSWQLISSLGGSSALWQSSYASAQILLSLVGTPAAVAIFTVTRTLERPIGLIISSVLDVDTSRAARAFAGGNSQAFQRMVRRTGLTLLALSGAPIAVMLLFPELFLGLLYGDSYADATLELRMRILVLVPLLATAPLSVGLTVLRDTGYLLRINLVGLAAGLSFLSGCYLFGTIDAATANASLVVMQLAILPFLFFRYRMLIRQPDPKEVDV